MRSKPSAPLPNPACWALLAALIGWPAPAAAEIIHHYGEDYVLLDSGRQTPSTPPLPLPPPWSARAGSAFRHTVYINFDGGRLVRGGNDSRENKTDLILTETLDFPAMDWSRFGGREQGMAEVLEELRLLYAEIAVELVTERPAAGDYTMVMVGGHGEGIEQGPSGTVGIAPLDCTNSYANDLAIVFGAKVDALPRSLALVIAHELGHTFGLEHVADERGVMYPALNSATCCWVDAEVAGPSSCGRGSQDSKKVLQQNVGVGDGDTVAPAVWFVRPGSGALLPPNFSLEVAAADDLRVHHVELYLDGRLLTELENAPFVAPVTGAADGKHTLKAVVFDWRPNQTSVELEVEVRASCIADGRCHDGKAGAGGACDGPEQCTSGICALPPDGEGVCVAACDTERPVCPAATSCRELDGASACIPEEGSGWSLQRSQTGCAVGGAGRGGGTAASWLLLLALLRRRRRACCRDGSR